MRSVALFYHSQMLFYPLTGKVFSRFLQPELFMKFFVKTLDFRITHRILVVLKRFSTESLKILKNNSKIYDVVLLRSNESSTIPRYRHLFSHLFRFNCTISFPPISPVSYRFGRMLRSTGNVFPVGSNRRTGIRDVLENNTVGRFTK
jgi:hypothetical protein